MTVVGLIPGGEGDPRRKLASEGYNLALAAYQLWSEYKAIPSPEIYQLEDFVPQDEDLSWAIYSMAGVGINGRAQSTRSYYVQYERAIVTQGQIETRVFQGIQQGYPIWLITSSAGANGRVWFDDCSDWLDRELNREDCMIVQSFSPITFTLVLRPSYSDGLSVG